jgi:hypothetical protein
MLKNIDVDIKLTPRDVAECIFDMDAGEQAEMLNILSFQQNYGRFCMQLQFIRDEIKVNYGSNEKARIADMIERFSEYFCEEMESDEE